jgi:hypothetical protein
MNDRITFYVDARHKIATSGSRNSERVSLKRISGIAAQIIDIQKY